MSKKQNKIKTLRIIFAIMVFIHLGAIFTFSQQDGTQSGDTSGKVTRIIVSKLNSDFEKLPADQQDVLVENYNEMIRTFAHGFSFSLVGFWFAMLYSTIDIAFYKVYGMAAGSSLLYAIIDEFHQSFIPGRACEMQDVLVDTSGALIGSIIAIGIYVTIKKVLRNKREKAERESISAA